MKLGIISDLHLEFRNDQFITNFIMWLNESANKFDKLIVAGDIHADQHIRHWFLDQLKMPYFYVLGNHDYYGYKGSWEYDFSDEEGIVGGCLWADWPENPVLDFHVQNYINDFRAIPKFTLGHMKQMYQEHKEKIFESKSDIVVTHFAPTKTSVTKEFKGDFLNPYFCNDLDQEILDSDKKLWIAGHIHRRVAYYVGDCLVVHNPLGYPNENAPKYKIMVIDTENLPVAETQLVPGLQWKYHKGS